MLHMLAYVQAATGCELHKSTWVGVCVRYAAHAARKKHLFAYREQPRHVFSAPVSCTGMCVCVDVSHLAYAGVP